MNDAQNIKKLLIPVLKGLPFIAIALIVAIGLASRVIVYQNPIFESTAKLKLDDKSKGFSNANLYKDFDLFSTEKALLTEVEVLKSKELIKKVLEKLDFGTTYYRVGKIRTTELYHESPFTIKADFYDNDLVDSPLLVELVSESEYIIRYSLKQQERILKGRFDQQLENDDVSLVLSKNIPLFISKDKVDMVDTYKVIIHSTDKLVSAIQSRLDIKEVDKDISIIRISLRSEVPEKSALFVNLLAETYIEDYVRAKSGAAKATMDFIDQRLADISVDLKKSEFRLEQFKKDNGVVNTRQETETGLREISQIKIQLNNLIMKEAALDSLDKYINHSQEDFLNLAPQVAFGDLLFTELIKKLKQYTAEREELSVRYTERHEKLIVVNTKIEDLKKYIKESISNSKKDISIQKKQLEQFFNEASNVFEDLPNREKRQLILEREFSLNQNIYKFLMEKRTEASIAEAATLTFHRIIEYGSIPNAPVSPNSKLLLALSAFLGLVFSLGFIYIREYLSAKINGRSELEKFTSLPVVGVLSQLKKKNTKEERARSFNDLASLLTLQGVVANGKSLLITSTIRKEGKTYVAQNLAMALSDMGWKVGLADFNLQNPSLVNPERRHKPFGIYDYLNGNAELEDLLDESIENLTIIPAGQSADNTSVLFGRKDLEMRVKALSEKFDLLILDSPATALTIDALKLMPMVHSVLYLARANYTKQQYLNYADMICDEYGFTHFNMLLNGIHRASNYTGLFAGSQYSYQVPTKGLWSKIQHYIHYYL